MKSLISMFGALLLVCAGAATAAEPPQAQPKAQPRILVFSKTTGFRHDSIGPGVEAVKALGEKHGFGVDATEDSTVFNEDNLKRYRAVFFLCTTGDILDHIQQADFERFI